MSNTTDVFGKTVDLSTFVTAKRIGNSIAIVGGNDDGTVTSDDLFVNIIELGVFKNNPARRLYERHGFRIVEDQDYKWQMRRDPHP